MWAQVLLLELMLDKCTSSSSLLQQRLKILTHFFPPVVVVPSSVILQVLSNTCSICFHFPPPLPVCILSRGARLSSFVDKQWCTWSRGSPGHIIFYSNYTNNQFFVILTDLKVWWSERRVILHPSHLFISTGKLALNLINLTVALKSPLINVDSL